MKNLYLLLISFIIISCSGSGSSTDENTSESSNMGQEAMESSLDNQSISENDNYVDLFSESACESFSASQAAEILDVPVDQLKIQVNNYGDHMTCSWGYYPEDAQMGRNISLNLYQDEYLTDTNFSNDIKSIEENNFITRVDLEVPNEIIATYRKDRGWLKVYISKDRMIQFQVGPTLQASEETKEQLQDVAIEFAEAFLSQ